MPSNSKISKISCCHWEPQISNLVNITGQLQKTRQLKHYKLKLENLKFLFRTMFTIKIILIKHVLIAIKVLHKRTLISSSLLIIK